MAGNAKWSLFLVVVVVCISGSLSASMNYEQPMMEATTGDKKGAQSGMMEEEGPSEKDCNMADALESVVDYLKVLNEEMKELKEAVANSCSAKLGDDDMSGDGSGEEGNGDEELGSTDEDNDDNKEDGSVDEEAEVTDEEDEVTEEKDEDTEEQMNENTEENVDEDTEENVDEDTEEKDEDTEEKEEEVTDEEEEVTDEEEEVTDEEEEVTDEDTDKEDMDNEDGTDDEEEEKEDETTPEEEEIETLPPPPERCPPPFQNLALGCFYIQTDNREWRSWGDANDFCQQQGGALAAPYRPKELMDYLHQSYSGAIWVGGQKEDGDWKWLNGRSVQKEHWKQKSPNANPGRRCMLLDSREKYLANNFFCGEKFSFICEHPGEDQMN